MPSDITAPTYEEDPRRPARGRLTGADLATSCGGRNQRTPPEQSALLEAMQERSARCAATTSPAPCSCAHRTRSNSRHVSLPSAARRFCSNDDGLPESTGDEVIGDDDHAHRARRSGDHAEEILGSSNGAHGADRRIGGALRSDSVRAKRPTDVEAPTSSSANVTSAPASAAPFCAGGEGARW